MTVKEALSQVCRKKLAIRTHSVVEKSLLIGACGMHGYDVSLCSPELWDLYPILKNHIRSFGTIGDRLNAKPISSGAFDALIFFHPCQISPM